MKKSFLVLSALLLTTLFLAPSKSNAQMPGGGTAPAAPTLLPEPESLPHVNNPQPNIEIPQAPVVITPPTPVAPVFGACIISSFPDQCTTCINDYINDASNCGSQTTCKGFENQAGCGSGFESIGVCCCTAGSTFNTEAGWYCLVKTNNEQINEQTNESFPPAG